MLNNYILNKAVNKIQLFYKGYTMQQEINKTINGHDVSASFYFTDTEVEASILVDGEEQYFYYNDVANVPHEVLTCELMKSACYRYEREAN